MGCCSGRHFVISEGASLGSMVLSLSEECFFSPASPSGPAGGPASAPSSGVRSDDSWDDIPSLTTLRTTATLRALKSRIRYGCRVPAFMSPRWVSASPRKIPTNLRRTEGRLAGWRSCPARCSRTRCTSSAPSSLRASSERCARTGIGKQLTLQ
eukprot:6201001-Pleurochrysis_carterae.AAC.2